MERFIRSTNNINIEEVPVVGFVFEDPDTHKKFRSKSYSCFEDLEKHVQNYRNQNGFPVLDHFREVWEDYICTNFVEMRGKCCPQDGDISRNFKQYVSGAVAYVKSLFQKESDKFVDQVEADRRAEICIKCRLNKKNYGHNFAQYYTDKLMKRSVGERYAKKWNLLYTCEGCSCILNSKVWFSESIVGSSLMRDDIKTIEESNKDCWQLECRNNLNNKEKENENK